MMALTHYNSLIKAHPAVTAALSSMNTHSHMGNQVSVYAQGRLELTNKY